MATKKEMLDRYARRLSDKSRSRVTYLRMAEEYLDYANGEYTRETVLDFLQHTKRVHHYKNSSLRIVFSVLRTFFGRNDLDWEFSRGDAPQVQESNMVVIALEPQLVREMITAVKNGNSPREKAFFALSTTYGMRRMELANLTGDDINFRSKTIHVATLKHGRERTHVVPDILIPYLEEWGFKKPLTEAQILNLWFRIEYRAGIPRHITHSGFHSIRRTLQTELGHSGFRNEEVMSFLRWKQRTSTNMAYRYTATTYVGRDGPSVEVTGESLQVDQKILANHPFLESWG
jgi:integrase